MIIKTLFDTILSYCFRITSPILLLAIGLCLGVCYYIKLKNKDKNITLLGNSQFLIIYIIVLLFLIVLLLFLWQK